MHFIADLHTHSPFSRATSKLSTLPGLYAWARAKGINLIGTGDFTHPGWFTQIKELLEPAKPGFCKLRDENVPEALPGLAPESIPVCFLLTAEVSCIYKRHSKIRKIHHILVAPDFTSVARINRRLWAYGNLESDGRPILKLDSRNLLEILLEQAPDAFLVPAHIWTPWFSLFGSKSGFDNIEECFGDLAKHIFALETGLSSDPDMNRRISALDRFTLISNSDCHSPSKLGREATVFNTEFNYFSMKHALENQHSGGFLGTIELFPEEGKYYANGHRKCQICIAPDKILPYDDSICPVCSKPLTIGVNHRILELADREFPIHKDNRSTFRSIIPLPEILGEIVARGPATKTVLSLYTKLINQFGSEFNVLLNTPVEELNKLSPILGEAINRQRNNNVFRKPGYDGKFGVIMVFEPGELDKLAGHSAIFAGIKRKLTNGS